MDPAILVGKPVVKGTRISVELVLDHLAENPDVHELFAAYPRLSIDDVKACLAYAKTLVGGEDIYPSNVDARLGPYLRAAGHDVASAFPVPRHRSVVGFCGALDESPAGIASDASRGATLGRPHQSLDTASYPGSERFRD